MNKKTKYLQHFIISRFRKRHFINFGLNSTKLRKQNNIVNWSNCDRNVYVYYILHTLDRCVFLGILIRLLTWSFRLLNYYLLLLYCKEVKGILHYQWFPRPIVGGLTRGKVFFLNFRKRKYAQFYRLLRWKCANWTFQSGWLFYITVPREVMYLNHPLLWQS